MLFSKLFKKPKDSKPVVIGYPRTGFTLLISIITEILLANKASKINEKFKNILDLEGNLISKKIIDYLKKNFNTKQIIFNKNFQSLLGGPNWIMVDEGKEVTCVRKYIGIKNVGDLTLIIKLPIKILDAHIIPHSHGPYKFWLNYKKRFASIRSSLGTINSACHSINAIASEYIQKFYPDLNAHQTELIRKKLAASKLTNLDFFNAMVKPMKENFEELIRLKFFFNIYKWEDIINNPINQISNISAKLDLDIDINSAEKIWKKLKFKNLTQAHKHNYRTGKAYVGDENESITNEHIEILKKNDFDNIHKELGYSELNYLDKKHYTEFQSIVSSHIKKNKIWDTLQDRELYWFAFQKSNLDFTKFSFKLYDWKKYSKIERTNIKNDKLIKDIWQIAENELEKIYNIIENAN